MKKPTKIIRLLALAVLMFNFVAAQSLSNYKANSLVKKETSDTKSGSGDETEDGSVTGVQSMPSFLSPLDHLVVIPSIEVKGSNTKWNEENGTMNELKLFISSTNLDSSVSNVASRLFIPAASKWGISYTFSTLFIDLGKNDNGGAFAIVGEVNFLGKEFPKLDSSGIFSKNTSSPFLHTRLGFEYQFLKDFLTIYGSVNVGTTLSNVSDFEEYYKVKNRAFGFANLGCIGSFYIDKSKENSFQIDFGGILQGGDVKRFTKSSDLLIPTVKIGVRLSIFDRLVSGSQEDSQEEDDDDE